MEVNGFDIEEIDIRVRDESVCYSIYTNIATYGNCHGKHKRRR
jgi:hypothetical protein